MDVALALTRLTEDFNALLEENDFEGAEELLSAALHNQQAVRPFLHFQLGRLYHRWNKLTSAVHHLTHAVDLSIAEGNQLFLVSVLDELNQVKRQQLDQRP